MVEVTKSATEQIDAYFKDKEILPIRIFLNAGGWGGPSLGMALDEPKETDHVYDIDGFKYIVDKEFMEKVKPIKIDFSETVNAEDISFIEEMIHNAFKTDQSSKLKIPDIQSKEIKVDT